MKKIVLSGYPRDTKMKRSDIASDKKLIGVVYGKKCPSKAIMVDISEFRKVFNEGGQTHMIELSVEGQKHNVIIHSIQRNPISYDILNIDFLAIASGEKVTVDVPVKLIGNFPGQKDGLLAELHAHSIEIRCLPQDLIDIIEVDISKLEKAGDSINIDDLTISKKIEILTDKSTNVVSVVLPDNEETNIVTEEPATETPTAE